MDDKLSRAVATTDLEDLWWKVRAASEEPDRKWIAEDTCVAAIGMGLNLNKEIWRSGHHFEIEELDVIKQLIKVFQSGDAPLLSGLERRTLHNGFIIWDTQSFQLSPYVKIVTRSGITIMRKHPLQAQSKEFI